LLLSPPLGEGNYSGGHERIRGSGFKNRPEAMEEGPLPWGRFPDFGRGNPPVVAPVVGRQEGRHGGATPTRDRLFQGAMHPFNPALTGYRRAETLLASYTPE